MLGIAALAAMGRWDKRLFVPTIYIFGLSLIYLFTLPSNFLIGSDNHIELYFANLTLTQGWDPSLHFNMNGALSITLLAPFLSKLLNVDVVTVFKVIFPLFYALVPVILFVIFSHFLTRKEAFISALFFIIVPTFFIEIAAIGRQQIAEVFFVVFLAFLVLGPERLKRRWKIGKRMWFAGMVIAGMFAIVSHYTTGGILMLFAAFTVVALLGLHIFKVKTATPPLATTLAVSVVIVFGLVYYGVVSGGTALHDFLQLVPIDALQNLPFLNGEAAPPPVPPLDPGTVIPGGGPPVGVPPVGVPEPAPLSPLIQAALGLDLFSMPPVARVFRLFQYATEILLLVGAGYFIWNIKKLRFSKEYLALIVVAGILILLCLVRPGFSSVLNASRFYHFGLMLLAPLIVFGARALFRPSMLKPFHSKPWMPYGVLVTCVLAPYLFFTSGLAFEAAKVPDVERFYMPYSYALSGSRLDLWGQYTDDDVEIRNIIAYLSDIGEEPEVIYTDAHGRVFLQETIGYTIPIYFLPDDMRDLPANAFVFLRSYNEESQTISYWAGPGMRNSVCYWKLALPWILSNRPIVAQSGGAILYGEKR